ncbi:kinesin-domain-containing protein [Rhizoclosmatium globosum]|uniref:Kinesin-like protein n=1 Tax=Rhizoclosmatium globosum TaxID=329046 RepID=A0A1Y2BQJ9_9FUNG|nr:kinesin-domain-containing protein [Rhizoclosmatium globosum]|eukprot:ORY37026.1 kinesin-domain-containing protein [Rhizoclosmatium globosum]
MSETDLVAARAAEPDGNFPEIKTTDTTVASNVSLSNIQTNSSVRVAVRIRPNHASASLSTESLDTAASHIIPKDMTTLTVVCPPPSANPSLFSDLQSSSAVISAAAEVLWEYDSVWNEQSDQDSLFKAEVSPLVNAFVEGFNATLFAYGQTGSGKTFTMGSSVPDMVLPSSPTKKTGILRPPQSGRTTPTPAPRGATASAPTTPSKTRFQHPTEPHPVSLSSLATTLGPTSEHFLTPTSGMIPRAIHQIFEKLAHLRDMESQTSSYTIKISFLELHNEEWIDLLKETQSRGSSGGSGTVGTFGKRPSTPSKNSKQTDATNQEISIREDKDGRISIHGATSVVVASAEAALKLLAKGSKLRSTAATNMNESSSRSHAIFSVSLTTTQMVKAQPSWHTTAQKPLASTAGLTVTSKFHFVDLAGSERLKRTQNTGDRKAEGISINQGLLVLGRVINCLTETKGATEAVVPYRDSKLTRFLQDSLGGNSKTVMLACISALEQDLPETINTLRYASRARGIQNKSRITIDTSASSPEVVPLLTEIASLKSQLAVAALAQSTDQQLLRDLERENSELKKGEEKWRDEVLEGRKQCDDLLVQVLELKMSAKGDHGMESKVWELESKLKVVEGENDYVKKLLKDTIDTKEQEVQSLKEAEYSLQDSVRNMQTKVASLENNLNLTRNENENLTNKLKEATVDLQTEKFLRNEMQTNIKDLEKSLAESQERESGLSKMAKKIQLENESELNLRWSDIKALQEKNSESIKLIENWEKELAESRAEIDLQKELHLNQTNSLKDEISSIKSNEQNLSQLLSDLQRKYEASETVGKTELDEVRNNLNFLTVENENLVKKLSEIREHDSVEIQSLQVKLERRKQYRRQKYPGTIL